MSEPSTLFNHITDEVLRTSLRDDHREVESALKNKNFKTVMVMSGSIIEAILIDYLMGSATTPEREAKLLRFDLGNLIDECKADGALSDKTIQLCTVVKNFRNLIHPGRVIRLGEVVTEEDAQVTAVLVRMVTSDVSRKRQETYGYTAEQVIAKMRKDSEGFSGVLPSLLRKLQPRECRRLLFDLLPAANYEVRSAIHCGDQYSDDLLRSIKFCINSLLKEADYETKQSLVSKYVALLHDSDQYSRQYYERSFLGSYVFEIAVGEDREVIKSHILSQLAQGTDGEFIHFCSGIAGWLSDWEMGDRSAVVPLSLLRCANARHDGLSDQDLTFWFYSLIDNNEQAGRAFQEWLKKSYRLPPIAAAIAKYDTIPF